MSPLRVTIRRAGLDDAPALAGLRLGSAAADSGAATPDVTGFTTDFAAWLHDHRTTHVPFLAEDEGRAVGMAWLMLAERVPGPGLRRRRCGDLQTVFVVPDLRGQGIGTALVDAVRAEATALGLEHVTVHANARAEALYRRAGFLPGNHWLAWNRTEQ